MRETKEEPTPEEQIAGLQETIAQLIVKNDALQTKLTNISFESNDIIYYLKRLVEEKDDEAARLEDMLDHQRNDLERSFNSRTKQLEENEKRLKDEIEAIKGEMKIMDSQLGNQHRIGLEMVEMTTKVDEFKKVVSDQENIIRRKEAEERTVRLAAVEQAKAELKAEYEKAIDEMKTEMALESKGHAILSKQVITHLETELERKSEKIGRLEGQIEEGKLAVVEEQQRIEEKNGENEKLRKLLEKSGQTTEKALRDSKRRLEESENRRKNTLEKYSKIEAELKMKLEDAIEQLEKTKKVMNELQDRLLNEQQTRKATVEAHKQQNQKIEELRNFLRDVLSGEDHLIEDVVKETRHAVFAHIALIVSRIPIVR